MLRTNLELFLESIDSVIATQKVDQWISSP